MLHLNDVREGIALILDNDINPATPAFPLRGDRVARPDKDTRQYGVIEVFLAIVVADGVQQDT